MASPIDAPAVKFNVRVNQYRYSFEDLLRIWTEADRLGFYSASLFDLLTIDALECWTTLTALLAQTQRIRAVPMVLANQYRHPVLTAKMVATLDVISGGGSPWESAPVAAAATLRTAAWRFRLPASVARCWRSR